jgi:hypothetical protein
MKHLGFFSHVVSALILGIAVGLRPAAGLAQLRFAESFDDPGPTDPGADGPANLIAAGWDFRKAERAARSS